MMSIARVAELHRKRLSRDARERVAIHRAFDEWWGDNRFRGCFVYCGLPLDTLREVFRAGFIAADADAIELPAIKVLNAE